MFGLVSASVPELTREEKQRYNSIYCGICREIRQSCSQRARLVLSYDMTFLALLLMSLYEPEETAGSRACGLHPIKPRPWVDNEYIRYAARMNVALAYYKCLDDWQDDRKTSAKVMAKHLQAFMPALEGEYPRQCGAICECIGELTRLEKENCGDVDAVANCFARLMAELMVYREDLWAPTLREVGFYLGRFVYLADAVSDAPKDRKGKQYNPLLLSGTDPHSWEEYLVLAMAKCTGAFERLPLVQDKKILDNILYSGVWTNFKTRKAEEQSDG